MLRIRIRLSFNSLYFGLVKLELLHFNQYLNILLTKIFRLLIKHFHSLTNISVQVRFEFETLILMFDSYKSFSIREDPDPFFSTVFFVGQAKIPLYKLFNFVGKLRFFMYFCAVRLGNMRLLMTHPVPTL